MINGPHIINALLVNFQESIVAQLYSRYSQGVIYTYIGDILLAVNPFSPVNIYGEEHVKRHVNAAKGDNPPHIFAIADQAYQMMVHQKKHQVGLIPYRQFEFIPPNLFSLLLTKQFIPDSLELENK